MSSTIAPCVNSSLQYVASPSAINPWNCIGVNSDNTSCPNAAYYASPTQTVPVYTPYCYEPGSSLSHFEDMCAPYYSNNNYYCMANAYGGVKRYPRDEERTVLCDLGYSLQPAYQTAALGGYYTYTAGACPGTPIWGVNDGIVGGSLIYTGSPNINIPISQIIANDAPATTTVDCVSLVYAMPGVSISVASGSITLTTTMPGVCGINILKYQPVDGLGNHGNVTYVYFYFPCTSCNPPNLCNMIQNGGFENTSPPSYGGNNILNAFCWLPHVTDPDIINRFATNTYSLPITSGTLTVDTWNGAPINNKFADFVSGAGPTFTTAGMCEVIKTQLSTPLVPGNNYVLSLMAHNMKQGIINLSVTPVVITIASAPNVGVLPGPGLYPSVLNVLASFTLNTASINTWTYLTTNLTFSAGVNHNCILIGINPVQTTIAGNLLSIGQYGIRVDDISLLPASQSVTFTPPSPICVGGSISNLGLYASPIPGTFSGPGVTFSGGVYDFNAAPNNTLPAGSYPIAFNYTTGAGCAMTVPAIITLTNTPGPFTFSLNPSYCQLSSIPNLSVAITPTSYAVGGVFTGTGVVAGPPPTYSLFFNGGMLPGVYSYTYAYPNVVLTHTAVIGGTLSCTAFASTTTQLLPALTVSASSSPTNGCLTSGQSATLVAASNTITATYTWMPGNLTGATVVVTPTVTTVYTVTAGNGPCSITTTIAVSVSSPISSFTVPPLCIGNCADLNGMVPPGTPTPGIFSGPNITFLICVPGPYNCPIVCPQAPLGTYNYTYSIYNNYNCPTTWTFNIQYLNVPTPTISIPGGTCIIAGQNVTLTAATSPSAGITYTWLPGGANTKTIVVTPSVTTVYTVFTSNGACTASASINVPIQPQVNFTNTPANICTGSSILYLENWLVPGVPTGGVWTAPFLTVPVGGLTAGYPQIGLTPLGTQTVGYTYYASMTCSVTNQFSLNIFEGFVVNTNSIVPYCTNLGIGAVISATAAPTPTPPVTYTWMPGLMTGPTQTVSPAVPTLYTVTASNGNCQFSNTVQVNISNSCCVAPNYVITPTLGIPFNSVVITGNWAINQDLTIVGKVFFDGEFRMAPGVTIIVANGGTLTTGKLNAHFYGCTDMWAGIKVMNAGRVEIESNSVIEDAIDGILLDGITNTTTTTASYNLMIHNVTFNRNLRAINISNYNQYVADAPFWIYNCVFTSRDLGIPVGALSWPNAEVPNLGASDLSDNLSTPHTTIITYPIATLKAPYSYLTGYMGVYIDNCGITINPTSISPTYHGIKIGDPMGRNLFDGLVYGIFANSSNVSSFNNTFQKSQKVWWFGSYGICMTAPTANNYLNVVSPITPTISNNRFYDCEVGIFSDNTFELNVQYADFRSTQDINTPSVTAGNYGILVQSNKFKKHQFLYNKMLNINTGISISGVQGNLAGLGLPYSYGAYYNSILISGNFISPMVTTTAAIGNEYVNYGIYTTNFLSAQQPTNTYYAPGGLMIINGNTLSRVFRGVYVSNFSNGFFTTVTSANGITLTPDPNTNNPQFGVNHNSNYGGVVNTNTVIGLGSVVNNPNASGVYRSMDISPSAQCNSVVSVFAGYTFAGNNTNTFWRYNIMNNNQRGLQLTNAALISQQGNYSNPSDNVWQGTWGGSNYNTWTSSNTFPIYSPLCVRTLAGLYPTFNINQSLFSAQTYGAAGTLISGNNAAPYANCFPGGGGGGGEGGGGGGGALLAGFNDIADGTITYTDNVAVTEEINENIVFNGIVMEPTLAVASTTLNNFYNTNLPLARGIYKDIESNLMQGNNNAVNNLLNGFNPNTNIENNHKTFYAIYNNYFTNDSINSQDSLALTILCYQCPFTDGQIVYQARNLYSQITKKIITYNDNLCEEAGFSLSRAPSPNNNGVNATESGLYNALALNEKQSAEKFKNYVKYNLYPNPAVTEITIVSNKLQEKLTVTITDVNGRILLSKIANVQDHKYELKFDLLNGIYFVNLLNEQGIKTVKKLVIAK